jgi:NADH-quinone oxidoreductase subunit E
VLEGKLNNLGIYHFWQIARWTDAEVAWVDGFLNFKGRIGRDNWISQAVKLAETSPAKPPR